MRRLPLVIVVALTCLSCQRTAPSVEQRARRIESQVWSPYCAGRLLTDCTTNQAQRLRGTIYQRLRSGDSDREVLEWLRRNYGDEVLARPAGGGIAWAVWAVPAAALLAGAVLVGGMVIRWRSAPPSVDAGAGSPTTGAAAAEDDRGRWIQEVRRRVERDL